MSFLRKNGHAIGLAGILLLAAALNMYHLANEGMANTYYAAGVKSMLESWHNFFFNSYDPGGFITIDKPPLGFWIQTLSAKLFGFNGAALIWPQAVAGVLSVGLLYVLVRQGFGRTAGLIAALVLAVTPIAVAAARNNTIDNLLVLCMLIAAWMITRAVEEGKLRWSLLSAAVAGLGYNIKMMEAFMALPAFYLIYLLAPKPGWKQKLKHLGAATVILAVVSLSWTVIVDSVPTDARPYIGSTKTNSVMELALQHNALERLEGKKGQDGGTEVAGQGTGTGPGSQTSGASRMTAIATKTQLRTVSRRLRSPPAIPLSPPEPRKGCGRLNR
ncbi:glycosyltransferase family 39 protein [Paenibacillus sp. P26]|nr:glycosyltransferase family 39 protein [Paenibacillus sp. P26]